MQDSYFVDNLRSYPKPRSPAARVGASIRAGGAGASPKERQRHREVEDAIAAAMSMSSTTPPVSPLKQATRARGSRMLQTQREEQPQQSAATPRTTTRSNSRLAAGGASGKKDTSFQPSSKLGNVSTVTAASSAIGPDDESFLDGSAILYGPNAPIHQPSRGEDGMQVPVSHSKGNITPASGPWGPAAKSLLPHDATTLRPAIYRPSPAVVSLEEELKTELSHLSAFTARAMSLAHMASGGRSGAVVPTSDGGLLMSPKRGQAPMPGTGSSTNAVRDFSLIDEPSAIAAAGPEVTYLRATSQQRREEDTVVDLDRDLADASAISSSRNGLLPAGYGAVATVEEETPLVVTQAPQREAAASMPVATRAEPVVEVPEPHRLPETTTPSTVAEPKAQQRPPAAAAAASVVASTSAKEDSSSIVASAGIFRGFTSEATAVARQPEAAVLSDTGSETPPTPPMSEDDGATRPVDTSELNSILSPQREVKPPAGSSSEKQAAAALSSRLTGELRAYYDDLRALELDAAERELEPNLTPQERKSVRDLRKRLSAELAACIAREEKLNQQVEAIESPSSQP